MTRRVVLLGGGHAHVQVLLACAQQPVVGAGLVLVSPYQRQIYSGMVPGLIAGHYRPDQCVIALAPLAAAAGAQFIEGMAVSLDPQARRVQLADGRRVDYDTLSIDTGAAMDRGRLPGAREHGLFVRPMEPFVAALQPLLERSATRTLDVLVLGGGAAGVELALALDHRFNGGDAPAAARRARLTLLTGGPEPVASHGGSVRHRVARVLAQRQVNVVREACVGLAPRRAQLANGTRLACDLAVVATGAEAPSWLAGCGLALDGHGFVQTGATLQSVSHGDVFAVGDVATRTDSPHPRSGVYAVRAGPPLAENLRRVVEGGELLAYRPQPRALNLIACGSRSAIASWGPWAAQGAWVWRWKDSIDRAFIAKYAVPAGGTWPDTTDSPERDTTRGA